MEYLLEHPAYAFKVGFPPTVRLPLVASAAMQVDERAKKHNGYNWEAVAAELGTARTPVMCLLRYQRSLNPNLLRSKWTPEEDRRLTDAVAQFGAKNWQQVASCVPGRNPQQCLHRYGCFSAQLSLFCVMYRAD